MQASGLGPVTPTATPADAVAATPTATIADAADAAARNGQGSGGSGGFTGSSTQNDLLVDGYGRRILLQPDDSCAMGGELWASSVVLLKYLESQVPSPSLRDVRVLEIGAGLGLVGIAMALEGAHVTATDLPAVMPALIRNAKANFDPNELRKGLVESDTSTRQDSELERTKSDKLEDLPRIFHFKTKKENVVWRSTPSSADSASNIGSLHAFPLEWGEDGYNDSLLYHEQHRFDMIVGADVVFGEQEDALLRWTLQKQMREGCSTAYLAVVDRPHLITSTGAQYDVHSFFRALAEGTGVAEGTGDLKVKVTEVKKFDTCGHSNIILYHIQSS